jgi:epoxyqueuosine reductase
MRDLLPLVHITPAEFQGRFKDSPILRATRDGFVRNVVVALGNSGRTEAIPALNAALHDPSPLVRSHAKWALNRMTNDE